MSVRCTGPGDDPGNHSSHACGTCGNCEQHCQCPVVAKQRWGDEMYEGPRGRMPWGYEIVPPAPTVKRVVQLWRYLTPEDIIQPGDHYASSMTGQLYRCTPDMMGKKIPYLAMPHLRPSGTMEVTG